VLLWEHRFHYRWMNGGLGSLSGIDMVEPGSFQSRKDRASWRDESLAK